MSTTTTTTAWKMDGKAVFDKGWAVVEKLGDPLNQLSYKLGCEAPCPMPLDQECDKAARILRAFCDGSYAEPSATGPKNQPTVLYKIPPRVIQNCVGLAIFTVMRTGLGISGASGSGLLIARKEDGSWSPPSGLLVHTLGVGYMAGIDIYDCVVVINNRAALEAFAKVRVSLGGEVSVVAGPVGAGAIVDSEVKRDRTPVYSYVKSRGLYAGAQLDGTVIMERNDENARFYGERLPIGQILRGDVRSIPWDTEVLVRALGKIDGRRASPALKRVRFETEEEQILKDRQLAEELDTLEEINGRKAEPALESMSFETEEEQILKDRQLAEELSREFRDEALPLGYGDMDSMALYTPPLPPRRTSSTNTKQTA